MDEKRRSNHIDEPLEPAADCIICAAGASRSMGQWKPSLPWPSHPRLSVTGAGAVKSPNPRTTGEPWLVDAAVTAALEAGCRVILVTGFRGDELEAKFADWPGIVLVRNEQWETGMVSSIKAGLSEVRSSWFFISRSDMPPIGRDWYWKLLTARPPRVTTEESIALRPLYWKPTQHSGQARHPNATERQGKPGYPVLFSSAAIPLIQEAEAGDSLKTVLSRCRVSTMETQDSSVIQDVDTLEQYINALMFAAKSDEKAKTDKLIKLDMPDQPLPLNGAVSSEKRFTSSNWTVSPVLLITGIHGAGKTSLLRRKAFQAFINSLEWEPDFRSFFVMISQVQTGRYPDGKATGFDIEAFYRSPEEELHFYRQPLCRTAEAMEQEPLLMTQDAGSFLTAHPILVGPYRFDLGAFEKLANWLAPALRNQYDSIQIYIDELGTLELDRHRGLWLLFQEFLQIMDRHRGIATQQLVCTVRLDRAEALATYLRSRGFVVEIRETGRERS